MVGNTQKGKHKQEMAKRFQNAYFVQLKDFIHQRVTASLQQHKLPASPTPAPTQSTAIDLFPVVAAIIIIYIPPTADTFL